MRGFAITAPNGQRSEIEATRYEVAEDGSATFFIDGAEQAVAPAGNWERIDEFGTPLSGNWPTQKLDDVIAKLGSTLGVKYGHYVHKLGDSSKYAHGYFNDLDALTAALLSAVDVDYSSPAPEVSLIRETLKEAFKVRPPQGSVKPSGFMTSIHCPRCGDTLFEVLGRRRALECCLGKMGLSEVASDWLREFSVSDPSTKDEHSSTVRWGGKWFCPADGYLMSMAENELPQCISCTRTLSGRLIHALIEFQGPHN